MSKSKFKSIFLVVFILFQATDFLLAQSDCIYSGNDSAWVSGFNFPGIATETPVLTLQTDTALIVIGGGTSFASAFQDIRGIGLWNGVDWYPIMKHFLCTSCGLGYQNSIASDTDGNLYVGGFFEGVKNLDGSEIAARNLAKYNASTGLWESLGGGLNVGNSRVHALLIKDGYLYAGGGITEAYNTTDTISVNNLVRYNLTTEVWEEVDGGVGTHQTSPGAPANGIVYDLEEDMQGRLIVAGGLEWVGSNHLTVKSIARWSEENGWDTFGGGLPSRYNSGAKVASRVIDVEVIPGSSENAIYAAGNFESYNNEVPVPAFFAKWIDGLGWSQIDISSFSYSPRIKTLNYMASSQELYIGGKFTYPGSNNIVSLNLATGGYSTFDGGTSNINGGDVLSIAQFNGDIYAVGSNFEYGQDLSTHNIARWDGNSWNPLGNGLQTSYSKFHAVIQDGNEIYAGGLFTRLGGATRFSIARFLVDEGKWDPAFDLNLYGSLTHDYESNVYAIEKQGDWLTIGGQFQRANQTPVKNVLRYNVVTSEIDTLGGGLSGSAASVGCILHSGDSLIVGGRFESANGEAMTNIAVWKDESWHGIDFPGGLSSTVHSLLNSGDTAIYVGGYLSFSIDGITSRGISAYQNGEWLPVGKGLSFNARVRSMQRDPNTGNIVLGGFFTNATQTDGTILSANSLVYWDGTSYLPFEDVSENISKLKYSPDSTLYVCSTGEMSILGEDFHGLARYKPSYGWAKFGSSLRNRLTPVPDDATVADITFDANGEVATVIGEFTFSGAHNAYGIARYVLDKPEDYIFVTADFESDISEGTVEFSNLSANANGYLWDFGDETTSENTNPTHTYENSGTYTVTLTAFNSCDTVTTTQEVSIFFTGLIERNDSEFRIYPNPAKNKITLSIMTNQGWKHHTATLYSPEGRILASYNLNNSEEQELQLPTSLESGIYFISLHGDTHAFTERLIIVK